MTPASAKKRVILISPLPPPAGGIASWTETVCARGLPAGYDVHLIDTRVSGRAVFDRPGFAVAEVVRTLRVLRGLASSMARMRPAIVHLNCSLSPLGVFGLLPCALLIRIFGIPFVCHYRGNVADFDGRRLWGLSGTALALLARSADANVAVNRASARHLSEVMRIPTGRVEVVPNFFDETQTYERPAHENRNPRVRAIFVGGITRAKGCAEIVAVAGRIPELEVVLLGKTYEDMMACLATAPNNVEVLSPRSRAEVFGELSRADIFIFPSHTEGFPNAVLEAMVVGLPVVATRVGAIPDMVSEAGGVLVAPGDVAELERAVRYLVENPGLRARMGGRNREDAGRFSYSKVASALTDLYDRTIVGEGARSCVG